MEDLNRIDEVEQILNYQFQNKQYLTEALTAAGTEGEGHQGNRWLGMCGIDTIRYCISLDGLQKRLLPTRTAPLKQRLSSYKHLTSVAKRTTIDQYIMYNPRSGKGREIVVGMALAAILGAVYLDSGKSQSVTWSVMEYIGLFISEDTGVDPAQLETRNIPLPLAASTPILTQTDPISPMPPGTDNVEYPSAVNSGPPQPSDVDQIEGNSQPMVELGHLSRKRPAENPPGGSDSVNNGAKQAKRPTNEQVDLFLARETSKCQERGLLIPEESYYTTEVQAQITAISKGRQMDISERLVLGIASSQSIVCLQAMIRSWRTRTSPYGLALSSSTSKARTFEIIQHISQEINCLQLFRIYHILNLFERCGGCDTSSVTGFVSAQVNNSVGSRRSGNPINREETELSLSLLQEIAPDLQPESPEYKRVFEAINSYRLLAKRLQMLRAHFGIGILALIPYQCQAGGLDLGVSERMLIGVPIKTLKRIVSVLDSSQGDILRQYSVAAWNIASQLLRYRPDEIPAFDLEQLEIGQILELPKNAPELLALLG